MSAHDTPDWPWLARTPEVLGCHGAPVSTRDVLERVVGDVLEQLVGLSARAHIEPPLPGERCLFAHVGIRGALTGVLSVAAPLALCVHMARGVMDPATIASDRTRAECAIAELANVTAGRMVLDIEPIERTWLSPPAVVSPLLEEWVVLRGSNGTACFDVSGMPLLVLADVKGPAQPHAGYATQAVTLS
ncbi:MAG: hypothetical protein JW733_02245 [Coriobacteriia bacterium]|nr:hypothetical protein [Coriobacteriia bacterium]MBN2840482.1 hypothetical protein [Coriobacteriia bacterium]